MNLSLLIMEFLPLVIYIVVDAWKGFRAGIIAAMISTFFMVGYDYFFFGEIDKFVVGEAAMILILGFVSLKMNNDRYFKFQPTVLAVIFAGVFAWFQYFDQPILLQSVAHMEKFFDSPTTGLSALSGVEPRGDQAPSSLEILHSDQFKTVLGRLSGQMIWLFLAHGLIMTYAAIRLKTSGWFAWRLALYPALLALVVINHLFV